MLLEVLVSVLCLGGYECSVASKAYYQTQPVARFYAKNVKRKAEATVWKPALMAAPVLVSMKVRHTLVLRLTENLTIVSQPDIVKLMYGLTF